MTSGRATILPLLVEAILTLGLVYAVGELTLRLLPDLQGQFDLLLAVSAALPLAASVTLARHTRRRFRGSLAQEVTLVSLLTILLAGMAMAVLFAMDESVNAGLAAVVMLESAVLVPGAAIAWRWIAAQLRIPGFCSERVVILGTGALARQLNDFISSGLRDDYQVVGFVQAEETDTPPGLGHVAPVLDPSTLSMLDPRHTDRVVVALAERRGTLPIRQLIDLRLKGIPVEEATSFIERSSGKIHIQSLLPSWLIFSDGFRISPFRAFRKRLADFVLAGMLLVVTAPVILLTAIAIRLEGPGPVFYRQQRVGKDGRPFWMVKFRSMVPDAEELSGPAWASEGDPRINRVGRVIRKLRIDELPQIWNVFTGEMSFVGPRPERPHFVSRLEQEIPFYSLRNSVRPGLTGWAQVMYRYGSSADDALEKLKYDVFYIKNASMLLDMWIVIKTIKVVLFASGSR